MSKVKDYSFRILRDKTIEITRYAGEERIVEIPNEIEGLPVTRIGKRAFSCSRLTNVVIPETVTVIESNAFISCVKLREIEIPRSVEEIGKYAFENCLQLTHVNILSAVVKLEIAVFSGCESLQAISFQSDHPIYEIIDGVLFNKQEKQLLRYLPTKPNTIYKVPSGVITIAPSAFGNCKYLNIVTMEDGITSIGARAFSACTNLSELSLPDSIIEIGKYAFSDCYNLKELNLPKKLSIIRSYTFHNCDCLEEIVIPENVTTIENSAIQFCRKLKRVRIPSGTNLIGTSNFDDKTKLVVERNSYAEKYCLENGLKYSYSSKKSNDTIVLKNDDHYNANVFIIADSPGIVTEVMKSFKALSLVTKTMEHTGIQHIRTKTKDWYVFQDIRKNSYKPYDAYDEKWETIMKHTESMLSQKGAVILEFTDIDEIEDQENTDPYKRDSIEHVFCSTSPCGQMLYCETEFAYYGKDRVYKKKDLTDKFIEFINKFIKEYPLIGEDIISIYTEQYQDHTIESLDNTDKDFLIVGGILKKYIGRKTVDINVHVPDGITEIGMRAFDKTTILNISIPNTVKIIGECSLWGQKKLKTVTLPESVISIKKQAFYDCDGLETIDIPSSVKSIGSIAFNRCKKLKSINVSPKNEYYYSIDGVLFCKKDDALIYYPNGKEEETYSVPEGTKCIRSSAFDDSTCKKLKKIILPDSLISIDSYAFNYKLLRMIPEVKIPATVETVHIDSFGYEFFDSLPIDKNFRDAWKKERSKLIKEKE